MVTGSCKRFTDLLRISYGLPRCLKDRFADEKSAPRIGLLTVFLIRKPFTCQSVTDPVRSGYVLGDFVGVKALRMKGMPQGHAGWVDGQ